MERNLDGAIHLPSGRGLLVVAIFLALFIHLPTSAADDSGDGIRASMGVDPPEASPGDSVTFRISVEVPKGGGRGLVIRDVLPDGLGLVSTSVPASCQADDEGWVCRHDDIEPLVIEIRTVVEPGTVGLELVNLAEIEPVSGEDRRGITVQASVRILPPGAPILDVDFLALQGAVVPDREVNYRIRVTNSGSAAAHDVSIVTSIPVDMTLTSAFPWPTTSAGELRWTVEALPVGSFEFLFNATLPSRSELKEVSIQVSVMYGDGPGGMVEIRALPFTLEVVPTGGVAAPSSGPGLLIGGLLGVLTVAVVSLLVAQRVVGFPIMAGARAEEVFLLHRSGVVLNHFSARPHDADSDIVGGMMAAVRMFVEDSVSPLAGPLREIRFGRGSILFVTGENVTLAAVNARGNGGRFADRATRYLREFERMNQEALANFDGVAGGLDGIDAAFEKLSGRPARRDLRALPDPGDVPRQ